MGSSSLKHSDEVDRKKKKKHHSSGGIVVNINRIIHSINPPITPLGIYHEGILAKV